MAWNNQCTGCVTRCAVTRLFKVGRFPKGGVDGTAALTSSGPARQRVAGGRRIRDHCRVVRGRLPPPHLFQQSTVAIPDGLDLAALVLAAAKEWGMAADQNGPGRREMTAAGVSAIRQS